MEPKLYYVADPMCSWCWGFRPVLQAIVSALPESVPVVYVMGGLAKDSDDPMPEETRAYVQRNWREVTETTGAEFNWDFWRKCKPRRSTYPACRAVLAARAQREDAAPEMFDAIQRAYYREARNPSDIETLAATAGSLSPPLDVETFERDIRSPEIEAELQAEFNLRRSMGVREFPSVIVMHGDTQTDVVRGWANTETAMSRLKKTINR
ncbi:MAG: DsbA family protein [Gemmatimonadota bacterium]|nr:DsbA family protein [Gemmatimonadota bacterium]